MSDRVDLFKVILTITTEKIEFTVLEYKAKVTNKLYILTGETYNSRIPKDNLLKVISTMISDQPHLVARATYCFPKDLDNAKFSLYSSTINPIADIKDMALKLHKMSNVANVEDIKVISKKRYDD